MYIAQKVAGDHGFVLPLMLEKGRAKVIRPEILAGMVLEMGTGAKSAPKGGLQELIDAAEARKQRPEASGKFGEGPYKDEPWSIVALRKRVYAIRKFYEQTLVGEQATRENNPGWDDLVVIRSRWFVRSTLEGCKAHSSNIQSLIFLLRSLKTQTERCIAVRNPQRAHTPWHTPRKPCRKRPLYGLTLPAASRSSRSPNPTLPR